MDDTSRSGNNGSKFLIVANSNSKTFQHYPQTLQLQQTIQNIDLCLT